jgi:hypothetical protein
MDTRRQARQEMDWAPYAGSRLDSIFTQLPNGELAFLQNSGRKASLREVIISCWEWYRWQCEEKSFRGWMGNPADG